MKLLLENWREFVKQEVEEFLPHGEVRAVEMIGSSALSPEERAKQDLEKYGFVQDDDERDIDIEVQIAGITREEAEEWAFSDEADELEGNYNYDVQLRIVENWRKFVSEDVDPKMKKYLKKHPYMEPDGLQEGKKVKIFRAQPAFTKVIRTNDYITMSRKFAGDHAVTSAVYNDEPFYVVYAFVDESDIKEADNPGEYLYIGEPFEAKPSQMATPEGDLSFIRGRFNEESEFQTKMKKNLPAELDFLLNKGPHNKKEGPGVKNPKKPKFKSAPPGAEGG